MFNSPSRYGGIAAVLVLGIGLLAVGKVGAGIGVLILGSVVLAAALSEDASSKAFFVAIGALLLSGLLGYQAIRNEVTGTATYHQSFGRSGRSEEVTREAAPAKFREATNFLWAGCILGAVGGAIGFHFYRKLDDCADEF